MEPIGCGNRSNRLSRGTTHALNTVSGRIPGNARIVRIARCLKASEDKAGIAVVRYIRKGPCCLVGITTLAAEENQLIALEHRVGRARQLVIGVGRSRHQIQQLAKRLVQPAEQALRLSRRALPLCAQQGAVRAAHRRRVRAVCARRILDRPVRVLDVPQNRAAVHRHPVRVLQVDLEGEERILICLRQPLADLRDLQLARLLEVGKLQPVLVIGYRRRQRVIRVLRDLDCHGLLVLVIDDALVRARDLYDLIDIGADRALALVHQGRELEHAARHRLDDELRRALRVAALVQIIQRAAVLRRLLRQLEAEGVLLRRAVIQRLAAIDLRRRQIRRVAVGELCLRRLFRRDLAGNVHLPDQQPALCRLLVDLVDCPRRDHAVKHRQLVRFELDRELPVLDRRGLCLGRALIRRAAIVRRVQRVAELLAQLVKLLADQNHAENKARRVVFRRVLRQLQYAQPAGLQAVGEHRQPALAQNFAYAVAHRAVLLALLARAAAVFTRGIGAVALVPHARRALTGIPVARVHKLLRRLYRAVALVRNRHGKAEDLVRVDHAGVVARQLADIVEIGTAVVRFGVAQRRERHLAVRRVLHPLQHRAVFVQQLKRELAIRQLAPLQQLPRVRRPRALRVVFVLEQRQRALDGLGAGRVLVVGRGAVHRAVAVVANRHLNVVQRLVIGVTRTVSLGLGNLVDVSLAVVHVRVIECAEVDGAVGLVVGLRDHCAALVLQIEFKLVVAQLAPRQLLRRLRLGCALGPVGIRRLGFLRLVEDDHARQV